MLGSNTRPNSKLWTTDWDQLLKNAIILLKYLSIINNLV